MSIENTEAKQRVEDIGAKQRGRPPKAQEEKVTVNKWLMRAIKEDYHSRLYESSLTDSVARDIIVQNETTISIVEEKAPLYCDRNGSVGTVMGSSLAFHITKMKITVASTQGSEECIMVHDISNHSAVMHDIDTFSITAFMKDRPNLKVLRLAPLETREMAIMMELGLVRGI